MKKAFEAKYDKVICGILAVLLWPTALIILIKGNFDDLDWVIKNVHWVLIFAICIVLPFIGMFSTKFTIDLYSDKVILFYVVNLRRNKFDIETNWTFKPSQIENVEVVRLTKEEKKKYTSTKFWFHKYLKIDLNYGSSKYVYVSHYSDKQIKEIIKLLTTKIDAR